MNVEIRNSFVKDAKKLPPSKRILLEKIIRDIMDKKQLSELTSCKKLTGFKTAFRIRFGSYRIGVFMKMKQWNLLEFYPGKIFINISHSFYYY